MAAFRAHEERNIPGEIVVMKWNPSMDLIAVALKSGDVSLYRLVGWQKVWTLPSLLQGQGHRKFKEQKQAPEAVSISCLEWRPDGKVLAVGYTKNINCLRNEDDEEGEKEGSSVGLIDVENAEIIHVLEIDKSIVTSMCWILKSCLNQEPVLEQQAYSIDKSFSDFLPKLKSLTKCYSNRLLSSVSQRRLIDENLDDLMKVKSLDVLNVLAIGTNRGQVLLYSLGLLKCGVICLPGSLPVRYLAFTDNLGLINVLAETPTDDKGEEPIKNYSFFTYTISNLKQKSHQFLLVSHVYAQVISLLRYLNETVLAIQEIWEDILLEIDSKLSNYVQKGTGAESGTDQSTVLLADEFMELLVFGNPSDSLEKFLHELGDKGLKKLGHSIELTYSNIQKLVVMNLQRVTHHLLCHLDTLRGISLWTTEFGEVGLQEKAVNEAVKGVGGLLMKSVELQQVIDTSVRNVKAFFRWLYTVMLRLYSETVPASQQDVTKISQQDIQFVAEFIEENFDSDPNETDKDEDGSEHNEEMTDATHVEADINRPTASNFTLERVGQYFRDETLNCQDCSINNFSLNPWIQYFDERPQLLGEEGQLILFPHNKGKSLVQEHKYLENCIVTAFEGPYLAFPDKISQESQLLNLIALPASEAPKISHVTNLTSGSLYIALVNSSLPADQLYLLKYSLTETGPIQASAGTFYVSAPKTSSDELSSESNLKVVDFQFYSQDIISLLLCESNSSLSYLAQVPIKHLLRSPVFLTDVNNSLNLSTVCQPIPVQLSEDQSLDNINYRKIENMRTSYLAVSGSRKVACVASASRRRVRVFETDYVEEEEEDSFYTEKETSFPTEERNSSLCE